MKKQITLIIASILFSMLFYNNNFGLNLLLFSIITIVLSVIYNSSKFRQKKILFFAGIYFTTAIVFFLIPSSLLLIAHIISLFVFIGAMSNRRASLYVQLFNGIFSFVGSKIATYRKDVKEQNETSSLDKIDYLYWFKIIGIPFLTLTIFILLYRSANPIFFDLIKKINLSNFNFSWIFFTGIGYYILSNSIEPVSIEPLTLTDISTSNQLSKNELKTQSDIELKHEHQLGVTLISVLNLLILIFLTTDAIYLVKITDVSAASLSKVVHEGIYALVTSILFAITIIIYFFRGNLNFLIGSEALKKLTILWIGLNAILVFTTLYKNYLYISHFGLTYKRIGVYVYLSLALVGLIVTLIKVLKKYNLLFLVRKNTAVAFAILILASFLNWDTLITKYNSTKAVVVDIPYLLKLKNNSKILKSFLEKNEIKVTPSQERWILSKYADYTNNLMQNNWQEMTYDSLIQRYENNQ